MGLSFRNRTSFLSREEERLYRALPLVAAAEEPPPKAISVTEIWFEEALDDDWIVAYRLGLQQQDTRVVVSEVRIFPAAGPREAGSGRWPADALGSRAPAPAGGIRARMLRIRVNAFKSELKTLFKKLPALHLRLAAPPAPGKRGRKTDLRRYAQIAVLYAQRYQDTSAHPTADVARQLRLGPAAARAAVARARKLGLLTETEQGEGGGRATPRALEILKTTRAERTKR